MKTFSAKPADVHKEWVLIDAEGFALGRLASLVATRLRGKHKAIFTPHVDCGDNVIVINAAKVRLTGRNKPKQQVYYKHTGHPGGLKAYTKESMLRGRFPERVVEKAVERMIPEGPLGNQLMTNLRIYPGTEHPHVAQNPRVVDLAARNPKNTRTV